ncbi:SMODS domain-containing nucleotidyltransferase [Glutamicibacter protophormiae]|uniref:Nucleotidyltransferase n=1 Tax=Glutamicibacter protophormiae TaxID=37930 RepID=A0ABS4XMV2_GLUPR|nr:hypothetical protein [Glutamicibacter protophormiae]MBP2397602.1 hypothetical protein [Glutamicibacter protophormiae]GGL77864.1 hypothetical protein GCM10010038_04920 [Glutamicibacter protophormiae]
MTRTTAQALAQFLGDVSATDYHKNTLIPARKSSVDEKLLEKFPSTSDMPFWKGILMGSASKSTIIRPIDDVDFLAVFSNENKAWDKYAYDSKSFIYRIRDAYNGISVQQVGTRGQAVRVFYKNGGHVDVAPVFHIGNDVYNLPNGSGGWISTAPTIANRWFAERNSKLGYHLAPMVRLLESWNRAHSKRMRSFHLETVTGHVFSSLGGNYRDALHKFFLWAPNYLDVFDPGSQGGSLSSYLTWDGRQGLLTALASAENRSQLALDAEARGDHAEAKRLWRIILGNDFPVS